MLLICHMDPVGGERQSRMTTPLSVTTNSATNTGCGAGHVERFGLGLVMLVPVVVKRLLQIAQGK